MTPMTMTTTTLASSGTNLTPIGIVLAIFVPICAAVAVIVWNYYRLQRHRADAVAMASYRKLAEEAVANMTELRAEMAKLAEHVTPSSSSCETSDERRGSSLRRDPVRPAAVPRPVGERLVPARATWSWAGCCSRSRVTARRRRRGLLSVTLAGLPVLLAAAAVIRWCAGVERARLRAMGGGPVPGSYREVAGSGVMARLAHQVAGPGHLAGRRLPGRPVRPAARARHFVVIAVWWAFLAGITLPDLVLGAVADHPRRGAVSPRLQLGYFPNGPHGHPALGPLRRHAAEGAARRRRLPDPVPALQLRRGRDRPRCTPPSPARCSARAETTRCARQRKYSTVQARCPTCAADCPRPRGSSSRAGTRPRLTHQHLLRPQRGNSDAPAAEFSIAYFTPERSTRPAASPAQRDRTGGRLERQAPQDRGLRLAAPGRRHLHGRPGARHAGTCRRTLRPGRAGRAGAAPGTRRRSSTRRPRTC